jgi:hypothetical protein
MFWRHYQNRNAEIDEFYARWRRRTEGDPEPLPDEDNNYSMGKYMSMGLREDIQHRARLAYVGASLLILGFCLQMLGALPPSYLFKGIFACN